MSGCLFCDVVDGEEPAHRIYADERTLAFLDVEPATPGHVLVVPTVHCETLTDMEASLVSDVFQTVRRVAEAIESVRHPDGVNIVQSNGAAAGQEVCHAHVHVVPRYEGDGVTLRWTPDDSTTASKREISAALRTEL